MLVPKRLILCASLAFIIVLTSLTIHSSLSSQQITIFTERSSYTLGETVYVYGAVEPRVEGERVNITVLNPLGKVWVRTYVTPDVKGNYGAAIGTVSTSDLTGQYRVIGSYAGSVAEAIFYVRIKPNITILTDKPAYLSNETILVSGKVSPYLPDYPVTIYIKDANTVKAVAQITPHRDGSFSNIHIYRVKPDDRGNWTVVASYGNLAESSKDIYVGLYINLSLSSYTLKPGNLFNLTGRVSFVVSGPAKVKITSPSGGVWGEFEAPVDADGYYSVQQIVYPYDEVGTYNVTVSYWGASNSTTFKVGRLGVNTFAVLDAGTFDVIGQRTSTFLRGQTIQISAAIKNTDIIPHSYVYIVQIRNERNEAVFLSWVSSTLDVERSVKHAVGTVINTAGRYTASIMIWDDWSNPTPLAQTITLTFAVI